jgi:hypothetical protein
MHAFDDAAGAIFPSGRVSANGTASQMRELDRVVAAVVDGCGFMVLADVADQYEGAVYDTLLDSAFTALGALFYEPTGLRCADLQERGYGAKDAVDYWFLWGSPPLMDADANGIPCQTVFPDVDRYLPAYY